MRVRGRLLLCLLLLLALGPGCEEPTPVPVERGDEGLSPADARLYRAAQRGLRSDQTSRYPDASAGLHKVLNRQPDHVGALSWLVQLHCAWADALVGEGKPDQARAQLARAKGYADRLGALKTDDARLHRALADFLRVRRKAADKGEGGVPSWKEIEARLDQAHAANPQSAGVRFVRGAIAMERDRDYDTAIDAFEEALKLDPDFVKARYFRALAHEHNGNRRQASWEMKGIANDHPGHGGAQRYLIEIATEAAAGKAAASTP